MAQDALKQTSVQGLQALHTAAQQGSEAAGEIERAATHPELKAQLRQGSEAARHQAERLNGLFAAVGERPGGTKNEISEGIIAASGRIMRSAGDETTRDAGIIASGQIALHYHIAAYGTLAAHAKVLGLDEAARTLHEMVEEAREADQRYSDLAERVINPRARDQAQAAE